MEKAGPVCVTGGTGFVASWLVMRLLQHGFTVRATVRPDPECKRDISFLTCLPRASENLHIFNADLNQPDSFNAAIEGCIGVFHVAHPVPDKELDEDSVTKKSVQGALGILKACLNSKTVKRVVYTSSAAAAVYSDNGRDSVDESTWSDTEYHRSLKLFGTSYVAAKTKTEQIALKFAEENELELVTLVPPLLVGGFLCKTLPASVYLSLSMILALLLAHPWRQQASALHMPKLLEGPKGRSQMFLRASEGSRDPPGPYMDPPMHVDDLVSAHIFLFENPNAKGRYICSSNQITIDEMSQFLSAKYPGFRIPTNDLFKGIEGLGLSMDLMTCMMKQSNVAKKRFFFKSCLQLA